MKRFPVVLVVLAAALSAGLCACSSQSTPGDGAITDGEVDADLDPCAAALPSWKKTWKVRTETTPLTGLTPDINLIDVWGNAGNDVYAVGYAGTVLHFDGSAWTALDPLGLKEDLEGVWGYVLKDAQGAVTRTDLFVAGSNGTILRYLNGVWSKVRTVFIDDLDPANPKTVEVQGNFHDIWGIPAPGPADTQQPTVIAVGGEGLIVRYDATANEFREHRNRVSFVDRNGVTHWNLERWSPERLGGVFGTAANNFVAVGNNGTILRYDGSGWAREAVTTFGGGTAFVTHLNGVWGRHANELFATGLDGTVVRYDGSWQQLGCATEGACTAGNARTVCGILGLCDRGTCICNVPTVYLRSTWNFMQSKCGPIIDGGSDDGGVQRETASWVVFAGWNGTLMLANNGILCPFGELPANRLEGMWGNTPRSEAERTLDGGKVECDPVEVFVTGVNGTLIRLTNAKGE